MPTQAVVHASLAVRVRQLRQKANIRALMIRIGFWGFLIITIQYNIYVHHISWSLRHGHSEALRSHAKGAPKRP